jgi:hypothetical protein
MVDFSLTIYSEGSYDRAMEMLTSRSLMFHRSQDGGSTTFEVKGTLNDYLDFQKEIEERRISGSITEMA